MNTYDIKCPSCGKIFKQHKAKYIAYSKKGKIINIIGFLSIPMMNFGFMILSSYGMLGFARAGHAGSLAFVVIVSIAILLWLFSYIFMRCIKLRCSCGNVREYNLDAVPMNTELKSPTNKWQIRSAWYYFTKTIITVLTTVLSIGFIICVVFWSVDALIMTTLIISNIIFLTILMALNNKIAKL